MKVFWAHEGAVVVRTGSHTGRSPNDKFLVCCQEDEENIWWGKVNKPFQPEDFDRLYLKMRSYFQGRDVFIQDTYASANPDYRLNIRVINRNSMAQPVRTQHVSPPSHLRI